MYECQNDNRNFMRHGCTKMLEVRKEVCTNIATMKQNSLNQRQAENYQLLKLKDMLLNVKHINEKDVAYVWIC